MSNPDLEQSIDELLSRSVVDIFPSKDLLKKELVSGKKLKIYLGADATGTALHLGHATNYMTLEKFRKLGHRIVILIGDFTARIGDPSDKSAVRVELTREEVVSNTKTWLNQLAPILDFNNKENPIEVVYNHDWLSKMTFEDVISLASNFTVQQMLERDMFEKRLEEQKPIYVHEFFYPLMQGYDSVHLDVDMELCGNDQTFNALAGRTLLKRLKNKEKFVFVTTLLENPKTGLKMMSKSAGTGVFLNESETEMYGKIMAQPDENILQLFRDCTHISLGELKTVEENLQNPNMNPKHIKMSLAYEITKIYHGEEKADHAQEQFEKAFGKKEMPDDIEEVVAKVGDKLSAILLENNLVSSIADFKRLVSDGAIKENGTDAITDFNLEIASDSTFKVGKKKFVSIKVK